MWWGSVPPFVGGGTDVAEGGMEAGAVVGGLQVAEDRPARLPVCTQGAAVDHLRFKRAEVARWVESALAAMIRVMDQPRSGLTPPERNAERLLRQFGTQVGRHAPADHRAAPGIQRDGEAQERLERRKVGEVWYPEVIRASRSEVPVHQILGHCTRGRGYARWCRGGHAARSRRRAGRPSASAAPPAAGHSASGSPLAAQRAPVAPH